MERNRVLRIVSTALKREGTPMAQCTELDDRADFYWKRAVAMRGLAGTLSAPEARDALLQRADEFERLAEALTREALLGEPAQASGRLLAH